MCINAPQHWLSCCSNLFVAASSAFLSCLCFDLFSWLPSVLPANCRLCVRSAWRCCGRASLLHPLSLSLWGLPRTPLLPHPHTPSHAPGSSRWTRRHTIVLVFCCSCFSRWVSFYFWVIWTGAFMKHKKPTAQKRFQLLNKSNYIQCSTLAMNKWTIKI